MSTGAECHFTEREPGRWYYEIQRYPYGCTEDYTEHGPFRTLEQAEAHLSSNYPNPGGYSVEEYQE